jgi:DNA-binding NtrC family response regulator
VEDLILYSKISAAVRHLGMTIERATLSDFARNTGNQPSPSAIIVDLTHYGEDAIDLAKRVKPSLCIGIAGHLESSVIRKAREAGYSDVLVRSIASQKLPKLLANAKPSSDP